MRLGAPKSVDTSWNLDNTLTHKELSLNIGNIKIKELL